MFDITGRNNVKIPAVKLTLKAIMIVQIWYIDARIQNKGPNQLSIPILII